MNSGPVFNNEGDKWHIDQQIGTQVNYFAKPPQSIIETVRALLSRGEPGAALEALRQAHGTGHAPGEVNYLWALATVGRTSWYDLREEQYRALKDVVSNAPDDEWREPTEVVWDLVEVSLEERRSGGMGASRINETMARFVKLPENVRSEIAQNLGPLMDGALKERFEEERAKLVDRRRLRPHRAGRAWKFFEPVPQQPLNPTPPPVELTVVQASLAGVSTVMLVCGLAWTAVLTLKADAAVGVAVVLVTLATAGLAAWCAAGTFPARYRPYPRAVPSRVTWLVTDSVHRVFDGAVTPATRRLWLGLTTVIRSSLVEEFAWTYRGANLTPGGLDYLVRRRVTEARRLWEQGRIRAGSGPAVGFYAGVCVLAVTALVDLGTVLGGIGTLGGSGGVNDLEQLVMAVVLTLGGGALFPASRADVWLVRRLRREAEVLGARDRAAVDNAVFQHWRQVLSDRPTDLEMARWLEDDKSYARTLVLHQYRMGIGDVVTDALLTEPDPKGPRRRAREIGSPWRYTAYRVWLYLLTDAGVRQVSMHLDFLTGNLRDQHRSTFRYDAIAAAEIIEDGIRIDRGKREAIIPTREHPELAVSQVFQLSLVSGETFAVTVECLGGPEDSAAELQRLHEMALDDSGVTGALRVLEQVAADGRGWLEQAKQRGFIPPHA